MTDYSLIDEALWSLGKPSPDVRNALVALDAYLALSAEKGSEKRGRPKQSTSTIRKKKKKKKVAQAMSLTLAGLLPRGVGKERFISAVIPLFEDFGCHGKYKYSGFNRMNNGTRCFTFFGWCPIHKKDHRQAKFQLKQHLKQDWCVLKCWKDDQIIKVTPIESLLY